MSKNIKKIAVLLSLLLILTSAFTACSKNSDNNGGSKEDTTTGETTTGDTTTDTADLSGTITMAGSTSMEKIANAASEAFMIKYPKVTVSAEFIGSGAGIEALLAKTVDIGNSSRELKDTETTAGAVQNVIAIDGIAMILDSANTISDLTKDQLVQIYTGVVKNWSELGGPDEPIVVVGREAGSGTRDAFEELLAIKDLCLYSNEINSTGGVLAKIASTPGAIGYVSLDVVDDTVKAVSLNSVAANEANIKGGTYLLSRPFVMATMGPISDQNELVQAFFAYLGSDEGKELIKSVGLFTVD